MKKQPCKIRGCKNPVIKNGLCAKHQPREKDPKKVAAGKARAASAIKDSKGKYISKILYNEIAKITLAVKGVDVSKITGEQTKRITELMRDAKITAKEVKNLYEKKPIIFEDMINRGRIKGTNKNSNQLEKSISEFTGKLIINGKEQTQAQAKKALMSFKQYLAANINVVDFTIKPQLSFDGKMYLNIPDVKDIMKYLKEHFDVEKNSELSNFEGSEITEALQQYFENKKVPNFYGGDYDELLTDDLEEYFDIVIYAS